EAFGPKDGEAAVEWALRLDHQSRNGGNPLRIFEELTQRLNHPQKKDSTMEMIRVLRAVTSSQSGNRIEVRYRGLPDFKEILTLVGLPASHLGEAWSWPFTETLMTELKSAGPLSRVLEFNAGSAGLSVALAKWGLAKEVVALDPDPNAAIVGNLNLALNGIPQGVRFLEGQTLEPLPEKYKADMVFASFPKGPILDSVGLSYMSGLLAEARFKLAPHGKVLLNVAGYPGIQSLIALIERRGYQAVVKQTEWVPQSPGIDLDRLARWEESMHSRLEFFRKSELGIPISVKTAARTPDFGYQRYLIEATPISAAKETSPNGG
ncbi:MAG TPA: 50S ribosomal protein L11 methyltransferase, partial [bacterium]|nr:50S ribosomal protein L11 methyltransferase [bacterium]